MPKKKIRQKHQNGPDGSTDTSDEENQAQLSKCCPHITKAVNAAGLKKTFKTGFIFGECQVCRKAAKESSPLADDDESLDDSTWLCLQCGYQGCGRLSSKHSLQHFRTAHSDSHKVVVNSTTWAIWCYECDDEVSIEASRRLTECIEFVRKQVGLVTKKTVPVAQSGSNTGNGSCTGKLDSEKPGVVKPDEPVTGGKSNETVKNNGKPLNGLINSVPKVKGLSNLGNTCFFNAVMQNLTQSQKFIDVLHSHCKANAVWSLPAECATDVELEKEVQLSECGALTQALLDFFINMNMQGRNKIANPNQLFGQVCKKAPQFRGFQQQDSHELLRHLLDGVRTEEIRRQKRGILRIFGLSEKVDANEVDEELKKKIKAFSRQVSHTVVDKVFGGQLISTVLCEECQKSSQVIEPFMDLSLPVGEEKPTRPGLQRRSLSFEEPSPDTVGRKTVKDNGKPSKYQEKKMKKQSKKEAKRQVKASKASACKLNIGSEDNKDLETSLAKDISEDENSGNDLTDADVEDNDETESSSRNSQTSSKLQTGNNSSQEMEQSPKAENEVEIPFAESSKEAQQESPVVPAAESSENCAEIVERQNSTAENQSTAAEHLLHDKQQSTCISTAESSCFNRESSSTFKDSQERLAQVDEEVPEECSSVLTTEIDPEIDEGVIENGFSALTTEIDPEIDEGVIENGSSAVTIEIDPEIDEGVIENGSTIEEILPSSTASMVQHADLSIPKCKAEGLNADRTVDELCSKVARLSIRRRSESKDSLLETPEEKICNGAGDDAASPVEENSIGSTDSGIGNGEREKQRRKVKQVLHDSKTGDAEHLAHSFNRNLGPRYQPSSHECSVMSCLYQFTMLELLTGNNKFGCENCTKNRAAKSPDRKLKEETVYSNASKQLLILCPPSILTLHLKRFQQVGMSLKKVNKFVEFPLILDLAPFCSSLALGLTHVNKGQQKILYSLYGVVEHSGRLTGGHYTAFVKVRKLPSDASTSFLNTFPIGLQDLNTIKMEMLKKFTTTQETSEPETNDEKNDGAWYHISDSHVAMVSESTVLRCQAYLLFYERIM